MPTTVESAASPRSPDQETIFQEVIKTLRREQPQNPGRKRTFIKLQLRGLTPQNRDTHLLEQTGWLMLVKEAGRIEGGWRATVAVRILATTMDNWPVAITNDHYEVYVCKHGKLELEDDYTDPELQFRTDYKLSDGLIPALPPARKPTFPPPDTYYVGVWLEGKPSEADKRLAQEVEAILNRERPQNPGRLKSLGPLEVESFRLDGKPGGQKYKYKITAWAVSIRKVERIPGGWRATVWATPKLKDEYSGYTPRAIFNHHTEVYSCRDGKLKLESEEVDPKSGWGVRGLR